MVLFYNFEFNFDILLSYLYKLSYFLLPHVKIINKLNNIEYYQLISYFLTFLMFFDNFIFYLSKYDKNTSLIREIVHQFIEKSTI